MPWSAPPRPARPGRRLSLQSNEVMAKSTIIHRAPDAPPLLRRRLAAVTAADVATDGAPRLFAYGYGWIAEMAGCDRKRVREALRSGHFRADDPIDVVRWIAAQRGLNDVASALAAICDSSHKK